jgi:predicted transcriptional regulator
MSVSSVNNWLKMLENGYLDNMTVNVLRQIKGNPGTDIDELRNVMDISHQTITSIVSNLADEGLISYISDREKNNKSYSVLKFVDSPFEQNRLKEVRIKEKYRLWLKKGIEDYSNLIPSQILMLLTIEQSNL